MSFITMLLSDKPATKRAREKEEGGGGSSARKYLQTH